MHGPLDILLADGVIEEISRRLKSGKEADLWLVHHAGELVAAKVYKARETRSFRNDAAYREGRQVRNTRTQRAIDRGTRFGQASAEEAWKAKESDALHSLHAAGVRVPRPVLFHEGVLLMELVLDAEGYPAPRLADVHVERERAGALYADLRAQAVRMLLRDLIHGDLSPYNVLLGQHGPVVIDFPQVVGAAHNSRAEWFFERDLENLRRHFAAIDPSLRANEGDAREIWRAYVRRELTPDFVPSGRASPPPPQRARPHAAPQESRPHAGGGAGDHARANRGRHPGRREAGGRPPDRRGAAPAPEVVRVVRPPLAAKGAPAATPFPPGPATPPAGAAHGAAQGEGGHRSRRRRRRGRR